MNRSKRSTCGLLCAGVLLSVGAIAGAAVAGQTPVDDQSIAGRTLGNELQIALRLPNGVPDRLAVEIVLDDEPHTIVLDKHSVRGANFEVLLQDDSGGYTRFTPGPVSTYRGGIRGEPGSVVNASLSSQGLDAVIRRASGAIRYVRPAERRGGSSLHAVSNVDGEETPACGLVDEVHVEVQQDAPAPGPLLVDGTIAVFSAASSQGCDVMQAELGFDADNSYYVLMGQDEAAVVAKIEAAVNGLNAIYVRDLLVEYVLGRVIVRTSLASDPFANVTNSTDGLNTMRSEWNTNQSDSNHDVAAHITDIYGGGIAFLGTVCTNSRYSSNGADSAGDFLKVLRHELGHNWGSGHYEGGSPEGKTIMSDNQIARFSGPELEKMFAHRNSRTCLDSLGAYPTDVVPYAWLEQDVAVPGGTLTLDVLGNDHDANCDTLTIDSFDAITMLGGTVALSAGTGPGGRDELTYTAPDHLVGSDPSIYTVLDDTGLTADGNVRINVAIPNALQGYWPLDEAAGSSVSDLTAYARHGSVSGATLGVTGQFGNAAALDGVDDSIKVPGLHLHSNTVTITAWINHDGSSQASFEGIFFNLSDAVAGLHLKDGELRYHWNNNYWSWSSGLSIPHNQWVFVALVVQSDKATLYLHDGGTLQSATKTGTHNPESFAGSTNIGRDPRWADRHFAGSIDEVRVYNYALTQTELLALVDGGGGVQGPTPLDGANGVSSHVLRWIAGPSTIDHHVYVGTDAARVASATPASTQYRGAVSEPTYEMSALASGITYYWRIDTETATATNTGPVWSFTAAAPSTAWDDRLVAHLTMDDADLDGDEVLDVSGAPFIHGDNLGALTGVAGRVGEALDFDGTDDRVDLPAMNLNSNTVTISAWIKTDGTIDDKAAGIVFSKAGATTAGLFIKPGNLLHYRWNASQGGWVSGHVVPADQWTHVALVVKPDKATVYMNGVASVNNLVHDIEEFDSTTNIGFDAYTDNPPRYFRGAIDDVAVWKRALSSTEIQSIHADGLQGQSFGKGNQPPVFHIDPFGEQDATTDQAYSATLADDATDPNPGDTLTFTKLSGPAWLNVAANGALSGTPGAADEGLNSFTVEVSDPAGEFDEADLQIQVDASAPEWTELTNDDFEAGFGSYTDGGSDAARRSDVGYILEGNTSVRLRDNTSSSNITLTNGLDLTGYDELRVAFDLIPRSMENGEDMFVEYWDGSSWHVIGQYIRGTNMENGVAQSEEIIIDDSQYTFPANALIRFRNDASVNNDRTYVDVIVISAK